MEVEISDFIGSWRNYRADIEAWVKNQRGENSMPPNISTVILPSRENGPVVYPEPITQLVEEVKKARPLNILII